MVSPSSSQVWTGKSSAFPPRRCGVDTPSFHEETPTVLLAVCSCIEILRARAPTQRLIWSSAHGSCESTSWVEPPLPSCIIDWYRRPTIPLYLYASSSQYNGVHGIDNRLAHRGWRTVSEFAMLIASPKGGGLLVKVFEITIFPGRLSR